MHQKQKKIPERVGAEDTGRTGRRLSGDRVNNPVTVIRTDGELLKARRMILDFKGCPELSALIFCLIKVLFDIVFPILADRKEG